MHHVDDNELTVLLVRHGQPGPGPEAKGLIGNPLTELGREQAHRLARRLATIPLSHMYCSDMARSYQTARIVSQHCPGVPVQTLLDLREVGSFHRPDYPPAATADERQQKHQQLQAVQRCVQRLRTDHQPGQIVAMITHGAINRLILATMAGEPISKTIIMTDSLHTSITIASLARDGYLRLKLLNCVSHLPASLIGTRNL